MININALLYFTITRGDESVYPARLGYLKEKVARAVAKEGRDCGLTLKSRIRLNKEVLLRHLDKLTNL